MEGKRLTSYALAPTQHEEDTAEDNDPSVIRPIARVAPGRRRDQTYSKQVGLQLGWMSVCCAPLNLPRCLLSVQSG